MHFLFLLEAVFRAVRDWARCIKLEQTAHLKTALVHRFGGVGPNTNRSAEIRSDPAVAAVFSAKRKPERARCQSDLLIASSQPRLAKNCLHTTVAGILQNVSQLLAQSFGAFAERHAILD